jgi:ABC-2 type transport system permease protein
MNKTFNIAKWEYLEKVKTKTFIISLFLTPAIIIGFTLVPTMLSGQHEDLTKVLGLIDTSGVYYNSFAQNVERYKLDNSQPEYVLLNFAGTNKDFSAIKKSADGRINSGQVAGCLIIQQYANDSCAIEYRCRGTDNIKDLSNLREAFNNTRIGLKLSKEGASPSLLKFISNNVDIKTVKVEKDGEGPHHDLLAMFFTSLIFIILLMMMVISSGGMLVRSLLEEKSNRLIEIIISSCTPNELLTGKVLGLSALGLTQVLFWTMIGAVLASTSVVPPEAFNNILPVFLFFALGFTFYSAVFVGIGSIVSTEQEAQQITSYLSLAMIMPIAFALPAIENPDSAFVHILSYIPLTIPAIMILRFNIGPVPLWEVLVSVFIMAASIYISIIAAGKLFRVGILSYGKRPSLKEVISWLKE